MRCQSYGDYDDVCPGVSNRTDPASGYDVRVSDFEFQRDEIESRFTLRRDGELVSVLDVRDDGATVAMTRAYTVPTFRGHGYAGELVDRAVASIEAAGDRRVLAVCWYVADWFAAHPDRAGILASRDTGPAAAEEVGVVVRPPGSDDHPGTGG